MISNINFLHFLFILSFHNEIMKVLIFCLLTLNVLPENQMLFILVI